ncbi:type II toxin-antitoxin system HicB family antitoxin [Paenibacillus rhizoplanae]
MKDKVKFYRYFATFEQDEDGITVEFPDLPGAITCGQNIDEAFQMAKDCLALHLFGMEEDGDLIPAPSGIDALNKLTAGTGKNGCSNRGVHATLPEFHIRAIREKKTLTIPKWLDDLAATNNVNYSRILQDALKEQLGVNERR